MSIVLERRPVCGGIAAEEQAAVTLRTRNGFVRKSGTRAEPSLVDGKLQGQARGGTEEVLRVKSHAHGEDSVAPESRSAACGALW